MAGVRGGEAWHLEVDGFFWRDGKAEVEEKVGLDGGGGDDVEGGGGAADGGRQDDGGVVVDEDGEGKWWVGAGGLDRTEGGGDGEGEGEVKGVAGNATPLVEAVGLEVEDEDGGGLDEGGACLGVEEEEVGEGIGVDRGGIGVVEAIEEGGVDGAAGDGGVGVDDVEEVVDEGGVELSHELVVVDRGVTPSRGVAILAERLEEAAAVAGDGAGDAAGDVAAEDVVAAEGANGGDLGDGGRVGAVVQPLQLAGGGLGGQEAAVGAGDESTADGVQEKGEEGEYRGG